VDVETGAEAPARASQDEAASPRARVLIALGHAAFLLAVLGMWEWASGRLIKPFWVSKPSRIAAALVEWLGTGEFWDHLGITVSELALGFLLGTVSALVIGFVFGEFRRVGEFFDAYLAALYGVPRTALAPLFILWFGIGLGSKVAQAAIMCFFLVLFNTIAGLCAVDPELINMARVVGSTRLQILTKIKVPSAFPYIMTGIKVGLPNALIGAIVAEFISSNHGVGYLIVRASMSFDTAGLFAGIIVLATIVFALNRILVRVERHVLRWRPESR
jgi:NitT/TauT family transport system permease protein